MASEMNIDDDGGRALPVERRGGEFWYCNACQAQNHIIDGECQYCECGGLECKRDSCSEPEHFHADHLAEELFPEGCSFCRDLVSEDAAQPCNCGEPSHVTGQHEARS